MTTLTPRLDDREAFPVAPPEMAAPAPPAGERVVFERLEYGKLCISPDGAIEPGTEALPRARSAAFPTALVPLCDPSFIGVGTELPPGLAEGWILRGVRQAGGVAPVACRLRRRPEDAEGGRERAFWLGRYLAGPPTADPLTCFQALRAEPLRGITAAEVAGPLPALTVTRGELPEVSSPLRAFLREAVVYALSAVPIAVSPVLPAEQFFRWASALWALLPAALRPAFTAAWGVAASEPSTLHLCFAPSVPATVALFDWRQMAWRPPSERVWLAAGAAQEQLGPWRDQQLVPGRMYLREAFDWGADGEPLLDRLAPRLDFLANLDLGMAGADPPRVIDLRSPWAVRRFTLPGLAALDHARLTLLESWLADPSVPDPEGLCAASSDYFTAGAREQVCTLAMQALETGSQRADRVLWASLLDDPAAGAWLARAGSWPAATQARAGLLQALAQRDGARTLAALAGMAGATTGEAISLPVEAGTRLEECLAESLQRGDLVALHCRILDQPALPGPYRQWALRDARRLTFALAARPGWAAQLRALSRLAGVPYPAWIAAWQQGEPPGPEVATALAGAEPGLRQELARRLRADWEDIEAGNVAERRQAFLPWLRLFLPGDLDPDGDPLLRLFADGQGLDLSPAERSRLAAAIAAGRVPAALQPRAAAVVLRCWRSFEGFDAGLAGWRELVGHWPEDVRLALGIATPAPHPDRETSPEVLAAVERLSLPGDVLQQLIARGRMAPQETLGRIVPLLWRWSRNCEPGSRHLAPDLCQAMARGSLPQDGQVDPDAAECAAFLARQSGFFRQQPGVLRKLWPEARRAWQILLLLQSAPQEDLKPTFDQLEALVARREDLSRHLALPGVHPQRRRRFEVATFQFHSQPFERRGQGGRAGYRETALWAAFTGTPFDEQGDLGRALDVYAGGEARSNQRERVKLAEAYLVACRGLGRGHKAKAAQRIAHGCIVPIARECGVEPRQLIAVVERLFAGPPLKTGVVYPPLLASPDAVKALARAGQCIQIATWFQYFLCEVRDWADGDALLSALTREARS